MSTPTITERLKAKGYRGLARETGVDVSHVSYIFSGKRSPSVHVLVRLARALDVEVKDLISHLSEVKRAKEEPAA